MRKYETEFKFKVVKSFLYGDGGAKLLARQWSVPEEKIRTWVSHYSLHGIDGLRPKRSKYSAQFKLQVLSHQDREQLSSRQVAAVYDIRNPNQVVIWRRKLDEGGVEAFGIWEHEHSSMKNEQRSPVPPSAPSPIRHSLARRERATTRGGGVLKKIASLDSVEDISCVDKARLIAELRQQYKLADLLRIAGLARSTFYYQCHAAQRANPQSAMEPKVRAIYEEHKGRYGYRRITAALCNSMAEPVNHTCVQRLMQKMGLRAVIRAKKRVPACLRYERCASAERTETRLLCNRA